MNNNTEFKLQAHNNEHIKTHFNIIKQIKQSKHNEIYVAWIWTWEMQHDGSDARAGVPRGVKYSIVIATTSVDDVTVTAIRDVGRCFVLHEKKRNDKKTTSSRGMQLEIRVSVQTYKCTTGQKKFEWAAQIQIGSS